MKSRLYPVVLVLLVFIVWKWRQNNQSETWIDFSGTTMGTIGYSIKYEDDSLRNFRIEIDSILEVFNQSLNHYNPTSDVGRFNQGETVIFDLPFFLPVLESTQEIYEISGGAFDPTVMPLVNAWGFGPDTTLDPDSATIDSLKMIVGFDKVSFNNDSVWHTIQNVQLDFSSNAKGYAIDVLIKFLESKGIINVFVEIGGELVTRGKNAKGEIWTIGITDPRADLMNHKMIAKIRTSGKGMATSANNYNYVVRDGKTFAHTLNPTTGYPVVHELLSATVLASNCMTADALATAFMVMGFEKAKMILDANSEIDAFLIYSNEIGNIETYATAGITSSVEIMESE